MLNWGHGWENEVFIAGQTLTCYRPSHILAFNHEARSDKAQPFAQSFTLRSNITESLMVG